MRSWEAGRSAGSRHITAVSRSLSAAHPVRPHTETSASTKCQANHFLPRPSLSGNYNPANVVILNSAAFADPNTAANIAARGYVFGDMGRTLSSVRSLFYKSEDFNVLKRTQLTEHSDILFQFSLLDAFNRHIFDDRNAVDTNPNDASFGVLNPSATIMGPRQIQLQLKLEF